MGYGVSFGGVDIMDYKVKDSKPMPITTETPIPGTIPPYTIMQAIRFCNGSIETWLADGYSGEQLEHFVAAHFVTRLVENASNDWQQRMARKGNKSGVS